MAGAPRPALRRAAVGTVAVALVVHLAVVVDGAWLQVERRTPVPSAESATRDLAEDLRRCGVDVVAGDYWAIYPAVWGSDARLRSATFFGPDRLDANRPASWPRVRRVAVLPPPTVVNGQDAANLVALRTGRGRDGWVATVHPGTNVRVLLERTASPLPAGCVGENGLAPS